MAGEEGETKGTSRTCTRMHRRPWRTLWSATMSSTMTPLCTSSSGMERVVHAACVLTRCLNWPRADSSTAEVVLTCVRLTPWHELSHGRPTRARTDTGAGTWRTCAAKRRRCSSRRGQWQTSWPSVPMCRCACVCARVRLRRPWFTVPVPDVVVLRGKSAVNDC